jgi:hypothetical protein
VVCESDAIPDNTEFPPVGSGGRSQAKALVPSNVLLDAAVWEDVRNLLAEPRCVEAEYRPRSAGSPRMGRGAHRLVT